MSDLNSGTKNNALLNSAPLAILSFCVSSICMVVISKSILEEKFFNMNMLFMAIQTGVCAIGIFLLKLADVVEVRPLNAFDLKHWIPVGFFFAVMLFTATKCLQYLPIPVYVVVKNNSLILITIFDAIFFGTGKITSLDALSFIMMIAGSITLGYGDFLQFVKLLKEKLGPDVSFTYIINVGYFWMIGNIVAAFFFVVFLKYTVRTTKFKDIDTILYNNLVACPILLIGSFIREDWENPTPFALHTEPDFLALMIITGLISLAISFSSAWCIHLTSSSSYSMISALSKIPVSLAGVMFSNFPKNFLSCLGMSTAFLGGILAALANGIKQKKLDRKNDD